MLLTNWNPNITFRRLFVNYGADMIIRDFWINKIREAWKLRPIVWLSGVRRVGKTTLSKMLDEIIYLNCDLPSTWRRLQDPESFYKSIEKKAIVVFDEIHRLDDPSNLLKIAADEYPDLRILATGSSTLAATKKFRDSLTGRKHTIYLTPVLWQECMKEFGINDLDKRLLHGGLPEPLLSKTKDESFFSEWIDSFYARDIQELFAIRNRTGFLRLLRILMRQSGRLADYTNLAKLSDLSRQTVKSHIESLIIAHALHSLSPFHGGGRREITQRPKVYVFDTGFITHMNGWNEVREEDRGLLWEHLVLDTLRTFTPAYNIMYWRDKSGREIDFIIRGKNKSIHTLECKINPENFNINSLKVFRDLYPDGKNLVICPFLSESYVQKINRYSLVFCPIESLAASI
jgi:predicted AAA+ superfamily ATPase